MPDDDKLKTDDELNNAELTDDDDEEYDPDEEYDSDDEDDEYDEDDDEEYDDEQDTQPHANLLEQLSSNPLFAQVSQLLTGRMNESERLFTQARMLQASGDMEGAAEVYLDIIDKEPEHFKAHEALGQALMMLDKPDQAEIYLQKAVSIDPNDPSGYLYLGYAHYAQEKYAECVKDFTHSVELEPDSHLALNNLGYAQYLVGDWEAAAESFVKSGDFGSDRAYYNLGLVRTLQGRAKEAAEAYRDASDLDPRGQQIEDHVGDIEKAALKYPEQAEVLNGVIKRLQS